MTTFTPPTQDMTPSVRWPAACGVGLTTEYKLSAEWRHRCEVVFWIRERLRHNAAWLRGVLEEIERIRGADAANRLRDDILRQWNLGNMGEQGDWRD